MKRNSPYLLLGLLLFVTAVACKSKRQVPDVSGIPVHLQVDRFDRDLFAIDTLHIEASLDKLQQKYPGFINDYLYNILALPPMKDSVVKKLKLFIRDYRPVYDSVQAHFPSLQPAEQTLKLALQLVQHYFPRYKTPSRVIGFVGPVEGYGNVLTGSGFAVGLQLYLGKDFPAYQTDYIREVYPEYQSRRFEAAYIPVNCMRNLLDDLYPSKDAGKPLVELMVESGKRLYVLDQLLPYTADTLKTGYTQAQLEGCYKHEALIWNFFLQNDLLYNTDPVVIRDYITDGPKTAALGDASPGNIGQFVGWQIVKKWMGRKEGVSLETLLQTPAKQILEEAKYKPK
jgi:hypothetical protein